MVNFTTVACRISSRLKRYKNCKNQLRLAKVIVKNKLPRFLWFTVYNYGHQQSYHASSPFSTETGDCSPVHYRLVLITSLPGQLSLLFSAGWVVNTGQGAMTALFGPREGNRGPWVWRRTGRASQILLCVHLTAQRPWKER